MICVRSFASSFLKARITPGIVEVSSLASVERGEMLSDNQDIGFGYIGHGFPSKLIGQRMEDTCFVEVSPELHSILAGVRLSEFHAGTTTSTIPPFEGIW